MRPTAISFIVYDSPLRFDGYPSPYYYKHVDNPLPLSMRDDGRTEMVSKLRQRPARAVSSILVYPLIAGRLASLKKIRGGGNFSCIQS